MEKLINNITSITSETGGTWGVVLEDVHTGQTWSHNHDTPFYAASIIKVPIMVAVFNNYEYGGLSLEQKITLRREDIVAGCGVLQHLNPGVELSIYDLTTLMIIQSDNTATNMLMKHLGMDYINSVIEDLGLTQTRLYHKLMTVPVKREGVNTVTAADMAYVIHNIINGKVVSHRACEQMISMMKKQQITDCLVGKLPSQDTDFIGEAKPWECAHKTGNVTNMRHEVGVLYVGNRMMNFSIFSEGIDDRMSQEAFQNIGFHIYQYLNI